MEQRPWLAKYPEGVPHDVNTEAYTSLNHLLEDAFAKFGSNVAFENMGVGFTFNEIDIQSQHFASYIQNHTTLKPGDRIALQMPNVLQFPIALFGALRAGLIVVNTNPLYTEREMEHQFKDADVKAVVILNNFADKLETVLPKTNIKYVFTTRIGDSFPAVKKFLVNTVVKYIKKMEPSFSLPNAVIFHDALKKGALSKFQKVNVTLNDPAFLQYTGGTTGVSKGAVLTHGNMVANLEQTYAWMKIKLTTNPQEIIITALPLYHIFSLTVNCLTMSKIGAKNILITNPKDIPGFIKELKKVQPTIITGVNTLFNALMNNPEFKSIDFSKLKITVGGGMAVQQAVALKWKQLTGCELLEGYGLTETSPVASCNPLVGGGQIGTIGMPYPNTYFQIRNENGEEVPAGERGEICIKGPQVMQGYWNRPDETNKVFWPDKWFRTGDVGIILPDGYFKIVDRLKDMILVSGFNVYPNEIEDVIAMNPKVLEVAAIGVPDEKTSEAVKVFVVKKDASLTKEELEAFCRENLTGYKIPRHYEFRTELPKSNIGKILRRELR